MRPNLINRFRTTFSIIIFLAVFQLSAQISMRAPEPAGGTSGWTAICAGIGGFNEYNATISWAGTANSTNEFILELSDASGNFANPVELARVANQNTNTAREFNVQFSIPTDTRGDGYKLRARSTSPVDEEESANAYEMYYMDVTGNLNISELGDGNPPGDLCSVNPITLQVDNIPNPETYQYYWYRSGTLLPSETGHTLTVTQSGMYQALIRYGNLCTGSANTDSNIVTATIGSTGPGIGITPPSQTALCAGDTALLAIDTTNPSWSYRWYKDGTAIPGAIATSFTVNAATLGFEGNYQVEISATGICTQRSAAVAITNADTFTATRNNPANVVVLPVQPEMLSVTTNAVTPTYQWYRNGSAIVGATNSSLAITQEGSYYAAITQSGGTCPGTIRNSETTLAVTPASFEIIIAHDGSYAECINTTTILQVTTINAVANDGTRTDVTAQLQSSFTYQWQRNNIDLTGATGQTISLTDTSENGNYTVNGVLSTYTETSNMLPVQLLTNDTVNVSSTSTTYCNSSDSITISTTRNLSADTFRWERNGTTINTTDANLTINETGSYRLVLDVNGCDLISNEIMIAPLDPDLITLDNEGDVIFPEGSSRTVTAAGADDYEWFNANNVSLGTGNSFTFTEDGSYFLIARIGNCQVTKNITVAYLDLFNIPNVITPNGDGSNDLWVIPNSYSNKNDVQVIIFDDKGTELIREANYQNNWPSSSVTFPKQNMVFYYVISNASEVLKKGTITVIR